MARWLVAAAIAWPALCAAAVWQGVVSSPTGFTTAVYAAASRICHQRPERSFQTAGVQWPVCGRCSGVYLGGALGALIATRFVRRRPRLEAVRPFLVVSAVPTVLTIGAEWTGAAPIGNLTRALAALPLGAAIAVAIVRAAGAGRRKAIG